MGSFHGFKFNQDAPISILYMVLLIFNDAVRRLNCVDKTLHICNR